MAAGLGLLAAGPVVVALKGIITGAGIGEASGALLGLDFWKDEADLHEEDLQKGAALIAVHSDDLHETARAVFAETAADRISD